MSEKCESPLNNETVPFGNSADFRIVQFAHFGAEGSVHEIGRDCGTHDTGILAKEQVVSAGVYE